MGVGGLADNKEDDLHGDKSTEKAIRKKQDGGKMAGKTKKTENSQRTTLDSQLFFVPLPVKMLEGRGKN